MEKTQEPVLMVIYEECAKTHNTTCGEFNAAVLQFILLRYTPATLHRLAASGRSYLIRGAADDALTRIGHTR